jgi:hypothetical protein
MAEASATLMPRSPALGEFNEFDDYGVEWCMYCKRYLNGPDANLVHCELPQHIANVKNWHRHQRIQPAPFPIWAEPQFVLRAPTRS